jgi:hypothetical protein
MKTITLRQGNHVSFYARAGGHIRLQSGSLRVSQPLRWAEGLPLRHDCVLQGDETLALQHPGWTWLDAQRDCLLCYAEQAEPVRSGLGAWLSRAWQTIWGLLASETQLDRRLP